MYYVIVSHSDFEEAQLIVFLGSVGSDGIYYYYTLFHVCNMNTTIKLQYKR